MNGQSARSGARDLARGRSAVLFMPHDPITERGRAEVPHPRGGSWRRCDATAARHGPGAPRLRPARLGAHLLHNRTKTESESCACFGPMLLSVGAKLSNHITRSWGNDVSYHPLQGDRSVCAPTCVVFQHRGRLERGARRRRGGDRNANTPDTGAAPATGALEEIVVTATRREENISKVPISITALNQDSLDQKGIRDMTEMVRFMPGVTIDTSGTNAISIRGISSSGGAGTTGIYIDDTPIQMRAVGFNPDDTLPKTFDLDRVEVLRGPQGTLFGAGSEGGTVRYIMVQPSVTSDILLRAHRSSRRRRMVSPAMRSASLTAQPIIDGVLGFRASIWYRFDGGWINRVDDTTRQVTDQDANRANTTAARFALLYQPIDSVKITPSIMYQYKRQHDLGTYWPAYSDPGQGQFNNATPGTDSDSRPVLSPGTQDSSRLPAHDADIEHLVLLAQRDRTRTRAPASISRTFRVRVGSESMRPRRLPAARHRPPRCRLARGTRCSIRTASTRRRSDSRTTRRRTP